MTNPNGLSKLELQDVAKQAVADCCSTTPEDVVVDEDGFILVDNGKEATAALLLCVDVEPNPCFVFQADLLKGVEASAQLYRLINEINLELPVGQVYFEEGCISYYYKLPTQEPSSKLLTWLIRVIVELIDDHDDAFQRALGGRRWADEDPEDAEQSAGANVESLEELMLRDVNQASNDCNSIMIRVIASYLPDEEIAEYADADDEDKQSILDQLDLLLHCPLGQFQDYFRGYYGTPDNNFHGELTEEGVLTMKQDEFFAQLNWQEILTLCRRHCDPEVIASRFRTLTGADYSSERERFPVQSWDGKPQWEMIDGQYVASE